jgi:HEAT repeat protein
MTRKNKIINFEPQAHLLEKAQKYVDDVALFLDDKQNAVPLLLRAVKLADRRLKHKILLMLGGFAKQEIAWPLYNIMTDPDEDEDVRHDASIQLSVTLPFLKDSQKLIDRLLGDLKSSDPEMRVNAAFALGWEGNSQAAIPLIELLYDTDIQVQQTAVNALSNLRDDRILNLLLERLEHGPREQKRTILFNLWRFYSKREEVTAVYLKYLEHEDEGLRFDALVLLGSVIETRDHIREYCKCLKDREPRIRELALKNLAELDAADLTGLETEIRNLVSDPEMKVKQAAVKVLKKIND